MKILCLSVALLLTLASSQQPWPAPIPGLSLTSLSGSWYVAYQYTYGINNANIDTSDYCYQADVTTNSTGGSLEFSMTYMGYTANQTLNFTVGGQNSVWEMTDSDQYEWIAFDPVSGSWGTLVDAYAQNAFILSRSQTVTNLILDAQIFLLQKEGYAINSTNGLSYDNSAC